MDCALPGLRSDDDPADAERHGVDFCAEFYRGYVSATAADEIERATRDIFDSELEAQRVEDRETGRLAEELLTSLIELHGYKDGDETQAYDTARTFVQHAAGRAGPIVAAMREATKTGNWKSFYTNHR